MRFDNSLKLKHLHHLMLTAILEFRCEIRQIDKPCQVFIIIYVCRYIVNLYCDKTDKTLICCVKLLIINFVIDVCISNEKKI